MALVVAWRTSNVVGRVRGPGRWSVLTEILAASWTKQQATDGGEPDA
jgi:hypothetical protein